jgi:hypothetical protein
LFDGHALELSESGGVRVEGATGLGILDDFRALLYCDAKDLLQVFLGEQSAGIAFGNLDALRRRSARRVGSESRNLFLDQMYAIKSRTDAGDEQNYEDASHDKQHFAKT